MYFTTTFVLQAKILKIPANKDLKFEICNQIYKTNFKPS